jgi:hypothetical protein
MVPRTKLTKRKMNKLYLKNGKEVHMGDTISHSTEAVDPVFGKVKATVVIPLTESTLPELLKTGILSVSNCQVGSKVPMTVDYYVKKIAERMGWKIERVYNHLNSVNTILPAAAFSMVLREIAIELDKKYEDHIEKSPEIYVISVLDGRITKANKAHIKNYRNFAAFRTIEDAKIACRITKEILKEMFKNDK